MIVSIYRGIFSREHWDPEDPNTFVERLISGSANILGSWPENLDRFNELVRKYGAFEAQVILRPVRLWKPEELEMPPWAEEKEK